MNMRNLFARYAALKKKVAGNYEKLQYEHTPGASIHERSRITPLTVSNRRILSQLLFALELSKRYDGKFQQETEQALALLESAVAEDGVLTNVVCREAEALLLPLREAAKEYTVLYAAHAHIDMNWMWGWQETVAITLSTFRTMLNLMQEYPEFTYSQSQASVYKIVEEYDPEMMQEIKARIKEGRWEVTANAWVETDKNMPDTESLIRHIQYTRKYLKEVWEIDPDSLKVDFVPDTFGHSAFIPEINNLGNVPYYYHCRGLQDDVILYRYRAPSGKEVLMCKEPFWYNSGVNPDNGTGVFEIERRCAGLKTSLIVYGVGNHGGGPTRRDIDNILEMQTWPVFPTLKFGTFHEYFEQANTVRDLLPVIDHELNGIFSGCYTTQSRIKLGNRRAEAGLLESETMNTLAHYTVNSTVPEKRYEKAWQNVLFTHFHDILTGSGVQETREHAMGKLAEAVAYAQTEQAKAYEQISRNVDTSMFETDELIYGTLAQGAGVGYGIASYAGVPNPERNAGKVRIYTVFNPTSNLRRELVEWTVWDYTGNLNMLEVIDHNGQLIPFQLMDSVPLRYWDHTYIRILVQAEVPPMGYVTYALREMEISEYPTHLLSSERVEQPKGNMALENEKIRATFNTGDGMLLSIVDKSTGEELLSAPAGLHLVHTSKDGMTAWRIGRYMSITPVTDTVKVSYDPGHLRSSITFDQRVMHSTVKTTISLDNGAEALKIDLTVDWHETFGGQETIPVLTYRLPLKNSADSILCDVPAGFVTRSASHIDVPALSTACAVGNGTNIALISDCKYGFRLADQTLSVTLINTSGDPDPYPERGIHAIKLFIALTDGAPAHLKHTVKTLISPMNSVPTARHRGKLRPSASLISVDAPHAVLSSVSVSEDDALTLRFFEAEGTDSSVSVVPPFLPTAAVVTNLEGTILGKAIITDEKVICPLPAHCLIQLKIYR